MSENDGVRSVWVKYYDCFGMLFEDHGQPTVDAARRKYDRLIQDQSVVFAQWGAHTEEGSIIMGEYRQHEEALS